MLKAEYSLPMHLHTQRSDLLEQHSESFEVWSPIIKTDTECKSLIVKLDTGVKSSYIELNLPSNLYYLQTLLAAFLTRRFIDMSKLAPRF